MSAFNNAQYNLAPFNHKTEEIRWITFSFAENVRFISVTSEARFLQFDSNENVRGSDIQGARGYIKQAEDSIETISGRLTAYPYFKFSFTENISIDSSFNISQYVFTAEDAKESVNCSILESSYVWLYRDFEEAADKGQEEDFLLSQFSYTGGEGVEVIDGNTSVEAYEEYVCDLSEIVLKPGEVIVVDAGNYDVLVNKQNAIYYQSGDWIDEMSRLTKNIKIIADHPENLSATILFKERYL